MTLQRGLPILEGSPQSIVYLPFVYMHIRVTLVVGLPYQLARVALAAGLSFCLPKPYKLISR